MWVGTRDSSGKVLEMQVWKPGFDPQCSCSSCMRCYVSVILVLRNWQIPGACWPASWVVSSRFTERPYLIKWGEAIEKHTWFCPVFYTCMYTHINVHKHTHTYINIHRIKILNKKIWSQNNLTYWHKLATASPVMVKQSRLFSQYGNFNSIYTGIKLLFFINLLALKSYWCHPG